MQEKKKTSCSNIGGQAVMEGIMMRSGDRYAVAVRCPDGSIEVQEDGYEGLKTESPIQKIPIVRGVVNFVDSLVVGIRCLMTSASLAEEEEGEKQQTEALSEEERAALEKKKAREEKGFMAGALLISLAMVVVLFMLVPYGITNLLGRVTDKKWVLSLFESLLRVAIFLGYLIGVSRLKDIQRTFMYHGAEHKCINCVESGKTLSVENVMTSSRFHKRCGTSFLFFVVIVSAVLLMFVRAESHLMRVLIRLALIPVIAGLSYEIIRLAGRTDNPIINLLSKPGLALQRLTTREPTPDQAEVAIAAVEAVFDWKEYLRKDFGWKQPLGELRKEAESALLAAGIEEAANDTELLLEKATGLDRNALFLRKDEELDRADEKHFGEMLKRRIAREPLQRITGEAWVDGRRFEVARDVLIPRYDTEVLIDEARRFLQEKSETIRPCAEAEVSSEETDFQPGGEALRVLDLCTGSGCVLISVLAGAKTEKAEANELTADAETEEKDGSIISAVGADISDAALASAKRNAAAHRVEAEWIRSDLFENIGGQFDLITANPPYINTAEIENLEPEVRDHEPRLALDGGADGLSLIRRIIADAPAHLAEGGALMLEIGYDQGERCLALLSEAGFADVRIVKDLGGNDRVVRGIWKAGGDDAADTGTADAAGRRDETE